MLKRVEKDNRHEYRMKNTSQLSDGNRSGTWNRRWKRLWSGL